MSTLDVRPMRRADAPAACAISDDATKRFGTIEEPRIAACADDPPFTVEDLVPYVVAHRAWVATEGGIVVGFVIVAIVDGQPHIEEVDVASPARHRGHGIRLIEAVVRWAASMEFTSLTLTTFRDVPWNAPWYLRHGFRSLRDDELPPGLRALREKEHAVGLSRDLRVAMRYDVDTTAAEATPV